jgi:hypothetical protein
MSSSSIFRTRSLLCLALFAATAATAQVSTGTTGIDASGSYQNEVSACKSGMTQQDLATCMTEARNAQAEKRSGRLNNADGQLASNALARCEVLSGEEKAACHARITGLGNTTGSVAGGGVLREVETVVVPAGATSVTIEPKTPNPVLLTPVQ